MDGNSNLRSWRDFARECFCFDSEAVNASGEAVRGLVKSRGASLEFNSTLHQSSHGFATRVHGFATKTKALAHEIPPATQAIEGPLHMSPVRWLGYRDEFCGVFIWEISTRSTGMNSRNTHKTEEHKLVLFQPRSQGLFLGRPWERGWYCSRLS